jgi:DNA-directed RNA polymerase specialized sigma24 family protein
MHDAKPGPLAGSGFQITVYPVLIALFYRRISSPLDQSDFHLSETKVHKEVTREKFANFLEWLDPEGDRAGEAYERLRLRLRLFFSQRRCCFSDELVDETINRVILKISEEKIENKLAYCYGVAKNVYRESLRKERQRVDLDEVPLVAKPPAEQNFTNECLDKCLAELSPENQNLILDYFSEVKLAKIELHRRISERLKVTQTALRMRIMRIKQDLKICIQDCMS